MNAEVSAKRTKISFANILLASAVNGAETESTDNITLPEDLSLRIRNTGKWITPRNVQKMNAAIQARGALVGRIKATRSPSAAPIAAACCNETPTRNAPSP